MFQRVTKAAAAAAFLASACVSARADLIPYAGGAYNPVTYSFTATATGDVIAYFVDGGGAGFENELGLLVNGVAQGGFGLNNHTSSVGDSLNFGSVNAGDALVFVLHNLSLGKDAYSDPSLNPPYDDPGNTIGDNHIYSTAYTATSPVFPGVPVGVYVAFEDIPFPGADFNYNDESFVFTNVSGVSSAVPEPSTWAMMLIGFAGLALAGRRRRTVAA